MLKLLKGRFAGGFGELSGLLIFSVDKGDVGQANESKNVPEVGLLMVILGLGSARAERPTTRGEDYNSLSLKNALRAVGSPQYGSSGAHDLVDPCFQRSGNSEVVHRSAEHNRIGLQEFVDQDV